jgi:hypothetical protein
MICDLCDKDSQQMIRAGSLHVCQWCVSNGVLEHALEVEADIVILRHSVDRTAATHRRDIASEADAQARLERAYAAYEELATAMRDLAASTTTSVESSKLAHAAQAALDEYSAKERQKTLNARQGKH